jgi:hypothetical protein
MNTLLKDLIIYISDYLTINEIYNLILVNRRFKLLKSLLIENNRNKNINLWTNKSLYLLSNTLISRRSKLKTLYEILRLAFKYPIFDLPWTKLNQELKDKLDLLLDDISHNRIPRRLFRKDRYILTSLIEFWDLYGSYGRGYYNIEIVQIFSRQNGFISDGVLCSKNINVYREYCQTLITCENDTYLRLKSHVSSKRIDKRYNLFYYQRVYPRIFYEESKPGDFTEIEWTELFEWDLKYNHKTHRYFENKQQIINYYRDKPINKKILEKILLHNKII